MLSLSKYEDIAFVLRQALDEGSVRQGRPDQVRA
jgi:hypothetical protein